MNKLKSLLLDKNAYAKYFKIFKNWPDSFILKQWLKCYKENGYYRLIFVNIAEYQKVKNYFDSNKINYIDDKQQIDGFYL